ncbi:MAG TPA: class I SAM-dependent methyltransferase [Ohtaekwangia sp.]|nr:class I SAM-dependent methyltransferase [Ohtaekwangia sp.]
MTDIKKCPICGDERFNLAISAQDFTVSQETFTIKGCQNCQLLITSPAPAKEAIGKYYQSDKYISHNDSAQNLIGWIYLKARNFTLKKKERLIATYQQEKTLLDYGCGTGEFVNYCKSTGWQVTGVEPSIQARAIAEQKAEQKIFAALNEIDLQVSTITLWHVLEHVHDLDETISRLVTLLKKNGTMFIAVPNHKSWDANYFQQYWAGYDTPRHLWHFNTENIKALFEKHNMKLVKKIPMKLDAFYISLMSEQYRQSKSPNLFTMIKSVCLGFYSNLKARTTGEYSSLIYVLKHES